MNQPLLLAIARLLLCGIFLKGGIGHVFDLAGMQQAIISKGIPGFLAGGMAIAGTLVLLIGGLSVLIGYQSRWGSLLLIAFLIPATGLFHLELSDPMQQIQFFKNLGLIGGLLFLYQFGPGSWSVDEYLNPPKRRY